jgi:hypothetical protein
MDVILAIVATLWITPRLPYEYSLISHVTFGEVATLLRKSILEWIGFAVGILVYVYVVDAIGHSVGNSWFGTFTSLIPKTVWYIAGVAYATYTLEGDSINWPTYKKSEWLVLNILIALVVGLYSLLKFLSVPDWVSVTALVGVWGSAKLYKRLIEIGRAHTPPPIQRDFLDNSAGQSR